MVIPALSGKVDGCTSDWRISRHPRIKLLSEIIIAHMRERLFFFGVLIVLFFVLLVYLRFIQLADLFQRAAVLLEFLSGLTEFSLRGQALVLVKFLNRSLD